MGKRLTVVISAFLLLFAMTVPLGGTAVATSGCNGNGTSDVTVDQLASPVLDSNGVAVQVAYAVTMTNLGPCNVDSLTFTDTLPGNAQGVVTAISPNSWSCPALASNVITCTLNANTGVPGTAEVIVTTTTGVPTGAITNVAYGNVASCTVAVCDPNQSNNTSYGGYAANGGTITGVAGSNGTNDLQKAGVTIAATHTGTAQSKQGPLDACPSAVPDWFGRVVSLSVTTDAVFTVSLVYDATLPGIPSLGQIAVWHYYNGTWNLLTNCPKNGTVPAAGCVSSISKGTSSAFVSPLNPRGVFYQILVNTLNNGDWTAD